MHNGASTSKSNKSCPVTPSGKKGGGVKVPVTGGSKGSKGSGYNR